MSQPCVSVYTLGSHSPKTVLLTRVPERSAVAVNIDGSYSAADARPYGGYIIGTVCRDCGKHL